MHRRPPGLLLSTCIDGFLQYKVAEGLSPNTLYCYRRMLRQWLGYIGDIKISEVGSQDISAYLAWLRTEYIPSRWNGDTSPLSAKTIRNVWVALSSFYSWAEEEFELPHPVRKVPAPRFQKPVVDPFTKEDVENLLKACKYCRTAHPRDRSKFTMQRYTARRDQAIVCTLLDTGLRATELHTMYIDKPMKDHGLMQAIARVNRVYLEKPGGLIVDFLGIATDLKEALAVYTQQGSQEPAAPVEEAVAIMLSEYEVARAFFQGQHAFDYSPFFTGSPAERLAVIPPALEHILRQEEGKDRFMKAVARLSKAFALAVPHEDAIAIRDEVAFFQAVRASFAKFTPAESKSKHDVDLAIQQLVSEAVASPEVIDIFAAAGIKSPDISILSDKFLAEIQNMPHQNLALELLRKLLNDEIKVRGRRNVVQGRSFEEMLQATIKRYQNRSIDTAQVITELLGLAKELRAANKRGEELGLNDEELAFYDALADNQSAVDVMGDKQLAFIAHELLKVVRKNVTIDWNVKQSARPRIRVFVKRILKKHGYPPDLQEAATNTVLEQAELLAAGWV